MLNPVAATHVRFCFMATTSDVIIIGGGIAGASAAYEIAAHASTVLLESEAHFGYHSTGRSAASFTENYGPDVVRRLVLASREFLERPPTGFSEHPILSPRGLVTIARPEQLDLLAGQLKLARRLVPSIVPIAPEAAIARVPILRPEYVGGAFFEPNSREIDVHGLHQGFLRAARKRGAQLHVNARVEHIERGGELWYVATPSGTFAAPTIVNAAGAWADGIAEMAGIEPLGLTPMRRTAFTIPAPDGLDVRSWPMVDDAGGDFYFKPDAGQLFISPADATPTAPTDAQPEEFDVATGVERFERATTLTVTRVLRSWAGLRTFGRDGSPVVGAEPNEPRFFWLAGQGGYGIKTSPALARVCAALLQRRPLPDDVADLGLTLADLLPNRLRPANASNLTGVV
jgi:D-arginine dehydrogenase